MSTISFGLTWNLLPLFAALAAICGAGSLLARLLQVDSASTAEITWVEQSAYRRPAWGWSFLLGMGWVGILLQIPLAIDARITQRSFFGVLLLCWGMMVVEIVLRRREQKSYSPGWVFDLPLAPRMIAMLCVALFVWFAAIEPTVTFDARSAFGLKAKILHDTGELASADFRNPDRVHFNANYPLLIPLIEATLFTAQGSDQNVGLQLLFVGFALACASVVASEVRRFGSPMFAAAWGGCFLLLPLTLSPVEGGGISGSADFPLAAFAAAAAIAAGRWLAKPNIRNALLAGAMVGAGVLTKQEGMVWLMAVGGAIVVTVFVKRISLRWALLTSGAAMFVLAFGCAALLVLNRRGILHSPYFRSFEQALHWDWLKETWRRPGILFEFAIQKLVSVPRFGFIWPFALLALMFLRRATINSTVFFWRTTAVLIMGAYFVIFTISPLHFGYQLRTSLFRLVAHFLPVVMLITAEQLSASSWARQVEWIWTGKSRDEDDMQWRNGATSKRSSDIELTLPQTGTAATRAA